MFSCYELTQVPVFYTVSAAANSTLLKCLHTVITNVLMSSVIGVARGYVRGAGAPSTRISSKFAQFVGLTSCFYTHDVHKMHYSIPPPDERTLKYSERGLTPFPDLAPLICQTSKYLRHAAEILATPTWCVEIEMQTDCLRSCFCLRLSVCLFACWFLHLSVSKVTPKVVDGFLCNFADGVQFIRFGG